MDYICDVVLEVLDTRVEFLFAELHVPQGDKGGVDDIVELVRGGRNACARWNFEGEVKELRLGIICATVIGPGLGESGLLAILRRILHRVMILGPS
jgi:hypothetical protein